MKKLSFTKSVTGFFLILCILALFPLLAHAAQPQMNVTVNETQKPTYGVAILDASPPAAATDFIEVRAATGYATRIKKIAISGTSTSGGTLDVALWKRSVADTSGTYTTPVSARYDSVVDASPANTVMRLYSDATVVPGAGLKIGAHKMNFGAAGSAGVKVWEFATRGDKPIILHAGQSLALSFGGSTITAGARMTTEIEFEEVKE